MDNFKSNTDGGTSNSFEFSVTDTALVRQLREALKKGDRVNVHYDQSYLDAVPFTTPIKTT